MLPLPRAMPRPRSVIQAVAERDALAVRNERLHALLLKLRRMQFGRKSERLPAEQLALGLEDLETAVAQIQAEAEQDDPGLRRERAKKRRASRGALPAHLPRIETVLAPLDTTCPCCKTEMVQIGEDRSERLDVIPAQYRVLVTRRPKFACRSCAGVVVQQPAPPRLIEGGIPTEATVANVVVSRFADHQPLYRQAQMMARQGVEIDRSTLAFWVGYAAAEIAPVARRLKEIVLGSARLFADETVVPVLDPGRGRTKQGYFWTIARDDRGLGRPRSAGGGLHLCARTPASTCTRAARRLPRHPAMRWLCRLQEPDRPRAEGAAQVNWRSAGATPVATSMTSRKAARRRSPPRHCSRSPGYIRSRPTSAASVRPNDVLRVRPVAIHCLRSSAAGS